MFPDSFTERLRTQEYVDAETLLRALKETSPSSIRINRAKWSADPLSSEPVPWCSSGFYLEKRPSYKADPLFHTGCYYPQEASSMFLEEVFRQVRPSKKKIRILDLCGAPGGKSTHLSSLAEPGDLLIANDAIRSRAEILVENITRCGSVNTMITCNDPADFGNLRDYFDLVLVDAPCSGEGMFRDPEVVKQWSVPNLKHCSSRQKRILMDAWPALKEGGILVYSTCTFNPEENEMNLNWLSEKVKAEFIKLEISKYKYVKEILYEDTVAYGFYPGSIKGEGFFISAVRKMEKHYPEKKAFSGISFTRPGKNETQVVKEWTSLDANSAVRSGDDIIYLPAGPEEYLYLSRYLKIRKAGIKICSARGRSFIPSHDLALSSAFRNDAFPAADLDWKNAIAYLRRDKITTDNVAPGWNIVKYMGVNMGFINNTGDRLNNYFPMAWRLRSTVNENEINSIISWKEE